MQLTVGLLDDGGKWFAFFDNVNLAPGTHRADLALTVDDHPSSARILAGPPHRVNRAIATKDFSQLTVIRIRAKPFGTAP